MNTRGIRPGLGPLPDRAGDNPLADALLGALDPARNRRFRDRYVGFPLDRGRPRAHPAAGAGAAGTAVAAGHLVPRDGGEQHGLLADELSFSPAALRFLIRGLPARARRAPPRRRHSTGSAAERCGSGPRAFRRPGKWVRRRCPRGSWRRVSATRRSRPGTRRPGGRPGSGRHRRGRRRAARRGGVPAGPGALHVTWMVGPMTRESASTWPRPPAGRTAGRRGWALAAALVSVLTGKPVRRDVAMSGELTLAGTVGMAAVILPSAKHPPPEPHRADPAAAGAAAR